MDELENKSLLQKKKIHLIAVSNKLMCDLAMALKDKGYDVSVSDISIHEPFYSELKSAGLLPEREGWIPENINENLIAVVPAAHIDSSNPELEAAKEKGVLIMSISEFIFERTKNKTRVVVAGSSLRKNMLTLIMNILRNQQIPFDFAVNSEIDGFDKTISLGSDTRIAIIEGDAYFTAGSEKHPVLYYLRPHIALITDLSWTEDSPTKSFADYYKIFEQFVEQTERDGKMIYNANDKSLTRLAEEVREDVTAMPYDKHEVKENTDNIVLETRFGEFTVTMPAWCSSADDFLYQINGARILCRQLGVLDKDFYSALASATNA